MSRANYHLTLGKAINKLSALDANMPIVFDSGESPGEPHSYRGYYSDLSLAPDNKPRAVKDVLADLKSANGATFTGYKGGDFPMGDNTPLWAARHGCTGPAIMSVQVVDGRCVLETREIED